MFASLESWLYDHWAGQIVARLAVTLCAYAASAIPGAPVSLDPAQIQAVLMALMHMLYSAVKKLRQTAPALLLLLLPGLSHAADVAYKWDLAKDPQAFIMREMQEGMWLGGAQKDFAHLESGQGHMLMTFGGAIAKRLEGQQPAYGPAIGLPIGTLGGMLASFIDSFQSVNADVHAPPFVSKLGSLISLDAYALYRPELSDDAQHHFLYGFGGKVTIPISDVLAFAKGSNGQKGL